jgi:heme-degrading monooxygenase HmoA
MHARVAAFENPRFDDPSLVDDLSKRARDSAPKWQEALRSALGHLYLVDRDNKRSLGITFFPGESDIREAAPVFERMGDEIPEEQRGKRKSVNNYEVSINEGGENANAARVSRLEGDPGKIDEATQRAVQDILPRARKLPGFQGAIAMVDRDKGRTLLVTLWESAEKMRSSEEQADKLRQESAEVGRGRVVGVERYEVMYAKLPAAVGASR